MAGHSQSARVGVARREMIVSHRREREGGGGWGRETETSPSSRLQPSEGQGSGWRAQEGLRKSPCQAPTQALTLGLRSLWTMSTNAQAHAGHPHQCSLLCCLSLKRKTGDGMTYQLSLHLQPHNLDYLTTLLHQNNVVIERIIEVEVYCTMP